jgi:hypothetical protein
MVRAKLKRKGRRPAEAAAVVLVLGDDHLLGEILFRLDHPTCLVRAASVCRRWRRLASDPAFLRRFRELHPPRILGIRVTSGDYPIRFFPVPQPKELAAVAARAAGALLDAVTGDWRNGRVLFWTTAYTSSCLAVRSFLQRRPDKPLPARPLVNPTFNHISGSNFLIRYILLLEDDGDATSCLFLLFAHNGVEFSAEFFILQNGVWGGKGSAVMELQQGTRGKTDCDKPLVSGMKVYMVTNAGCILVLDLATASFFSIDLPLGTGHSTTVKLSSAQQSGLYLIDVAGFCLRVWHGDGGGQWVLADTISVREACAHLNVQKWECDDGIGAGGQRNRLLYAVG